MSEAMLKREISLTINGKTHALAVEPRLFGKTEEIQIDDI